MLKSYRYWINLLRKLEKINTKMFTRKKKDFPAEKSEFAAFLYNAVVLASVSDTRAREFESCDDCFNQDLWMLVIIKHAPPSEGFLLLFKLNSSLLRVTLQFFTSKMPPHHYSCIPLERLFWIDFIKSRLMAPGSRPPDSAPKRIHEFWMSSVSKLQKKVLTKSLMWFESRRILKPISRPKCFQSPFHFISHLT